MGLPVLEMVFCGDCLEDLRSWARENFGRPVQVDVVYYAGWPRGRDLQEVELVKIGRTRQPDPASRARKYGDLLAVNRENTEWQVHYRYAEVRIPRESLPPGVEPSIEWFRATKRLRQEIQELAI